jgi:hypothetical protein
VMEHAPLAADRIHLMPVEASMADRDAQAY